MARIAYNHFTLLVLMTIAGLSIAGAGSNPIYEAADRLLVSEVELEESVQHDQHPRVPKTLRDPAREPKRGSKTVEEWLKQHEIRAMEAQYWEHKGKIARLKAEVANYRKRCREAGDENCTLPRALIVEDRLGAVQPPPNIYAVSGRSVQVRMGDSLVWLELGDSYAGFVIKEVTVDYVVLRSPDGEEIYVAVGSQSKQIVQEVEGDAAQ